MKNDMGIWVHSIRVKKVIGNKQETYLGYNNEEYSKEDVIVVLQALIDKLRK